MKALVTGAGGFLGLYIVERLVARGNAVRAFCRGSYPELDRLGVETIRGDIRNRNETIAACQGVDTVFHVAALAGISMRWSDFYEINVLGTRHVVEGCRTHGVGRLVYTSSPSVTFDGSDQEGVDESAPYPERFLAHYPHTKAIAEREVLEANGSDGFLTCALRPHLIWGPRDRHLIPRLLARARSGRLRRVGDGKNLVDMIYVENAAEAHLQAADALTDGSPVGGRAYFLSQGEPVNCWDWINDILALAGIPPVNKSISASAAHRVGAVLEGIYRVLGLRGEPPMTRFLAAQLSTHHYFDVTRAREDFGYNPRVSTVEGMRRLGEELAR
ncbi:MAG: NAD-dependent epimerase/dehydratase family protein [Planctomycetaceae bacterium]|nr:NAD-dependent epimerase/dehydratase family protein [Planctomycetaceae bacterium]